MEIIRGLVRPLVTFLVILTLITIVVYLVVKFGDMNMARDALLAFLGILGPTVGIWFGSRMTKPPGNNPPA